MPGMTICTDEMYPSDEDLNVGSPSIGLKDCNSTNRLPGNNESKSATTTNTITTTTTTTTTSTTPKTANDSCASVTVSKATTNSISKSQTKKSASSGSSSFPTTSEHQTKSSIFGTKFQKNSNTSSMVPSSSNQKSLNYQQDQEVSFDQQQKPRTFICPSCSSPDVVEVNLKLKTCQRCHEVVVDELNYKSQLNGSKKSLESTSNSSLGSQYNQHIAIITKKLKNIYKNRIHSTSLDVAKSSKSNKKMPNEIVQSSSQSEISVIAKTSMISTSNSTEIIDSVTKSTTQNVTTSAIATVSDIAASPSSHKPEERSHSQDNQHVHNHINHQNLCNYNSVSNDLPLNTDSNKNLMNKDVLILRICDLDVKLKSKENNEEMSPTKGSNANCNSNVNNKNLVSKNSRSLQPQQQQRSPQSGSRGQSPQSHMMPKQGSPSAGKISPKSKQNKSIGTHDYDTLTRNKVKSDTINVKSTSRKIVVISEEFKKRSERRTDVRIERRKEMLKRFRQNNAISKSLEALAAGETDILKRKSTIASNMVNERAYIYSKSVTNLDKTDDPMYSDDDDDDGQLVGMNSVELIFISDEFLNRAVKHDLKIIKNKKLISSPEPSDILQSTQQQQLATKQIIKKKTKKSQTIQTSPRSGTAQLKAKRMEKQQSLSVSPKSMLNKGTSTMSTSLSSGNIKSLSTSSSTASCSTSGNKKLIIISEDFKRKSLENNVVIVDDATRSTLESDTLDAIACRRRNIKQFKLTRQQSSIDDIGNQMTTQAFCSFEEPDFQCLENKELQSPD